MEEKQEIDETLNDGQDTGDSQELDDVMGTMKKAKPKVRKLIRHSKQTISTISRIQEKDWSPVLKYKRRMSKSKNKNWWSSPHEDNNGNSFSPLHDGKQGKESSKRSNSRRGSIGWRGGRGSLGLAR